MARYLDIETWSRRDHFAFFRRYEHPFFNLCVQLRLSRLVDFCRESGYPFTRAYHFLALKAANDVECFRFRLRDDRVLIHDRINGGTTVLLEDETFTFCYFAFDAAFDRFRVGFEAAIVEARSDGYTFDPQDDRDDLIHFTVLPWISFTSLSHPRKRRSSDSTPKIAFGQIDGEGTERRMPVSVEVHHALVDGIHVGRYFEALEQYFRDPEPAFLL